MLKKFDIREWILSIKYWLLLFIPHISIYLIYILYILIGASIIQEIESNNIETSSLVNNFQRERERLLIKIIDKREKFDLEQFTKYVYRNIRQYEEEIKNHFIKKENLSLNYSQSLIFISTTLTTIGSNEFIPKNKFGKLFLMIYTGLGIPLTLIFLTNLSYLINQLIIYFYIYLTKYFLYIQHYLFFRFLKQKKFNFSQITLNIDKNLTIIQLIIVLFLYLLIGTYFISTKSFLENFYLIFTSLFTINFNRKIYQNRNCFFIIIYIIIGLAIVLLYIETIKKRMEIFLKIIGNKLFQNLIELTQQMGFHDLITDDLLTNSDIKLSSISDSISSSHRNLTPTISIEQSSTFRPIGIAEPLRRLSTGIIRVFKNNDNDDNRRVDKSVQVSTIIRRCGRCAETSLPIRPMRKHSAISTSSSSLTENNSSFDDDDDNDDTIDFLPLPPTLDRIRQRRATLVAKTIIHQLATQPRSSSIDELIPPTIKPSINRRPRSADASPVSVKYSVKISTPSDSPPKHDNREEFSEISKQISSLLIPSDDENDLN